MFIPIYLVLVAVRLRPSTDVFTHMMLGSRVCSARQLGNHLTELHRLLSLLSHEAHGLEAPSCVPRRIVLCQLDEVEVQG